MNGYVLYGYMLLSHKANKQKTRYFNLARFTCKYVTCNTQTTFLTKGYLIQSLTAQI